MATTASDPTVILSIARTPMGSMQGALADASATDLGATAVKAAVERAGVSGDDIDRIYMPAPQVTPVTRPLVRSRTP